MTPQKESQESTRLYRHVELKLESVVQGLLSAKTNGRDNILSEVQGMVERIFVRTAMHLSGNNISRASRLLGISRNTLARKLRELDKSASDV